MVGKKKKMGSSTVTERERKCPAAVSGDFFEVDVADKISISWRGRQPKSL